MAFGIGEAMALSAALSAIGSTAGMAGTLAANKRVAKMNNEFNLEMWNKQNAYNTPEAQMKRYMDAGLNPNLMYGSATPGNATTAPVMSAPEPPNYQKYGQEMSKAFDPVQMLQYAEMLRGQKLQNDNIEETNRSIKIKNLNETLKAIDAWAKTRGRDNVFNGMLSDSDGKPVVNTWESRFVRDIMLDAFGNTPDNWYGEEYWTKYFSQDLYGREVDNAGKPIKNLLTSNQANEAYERAQREKRYNEDFRELGLRETDPAWLRVIAVLLKHLGVDKDRISGWLDKLTK